MNYGFVPDIDYLPMALLAPSGTRTVFNMATPPLGWVQDTTAAYSDCSLRVHTAGNPVVNGTVVWSSWNFGGAINTASITLTVAQLPVHTHTINDPTHVASAPGYNLMGAGGGVNTSPNAGGGQAIYEVTSTSSANAAGVVVSNAGSGGSYSHTIAGPQVKYNDYMIGIKSP
jgi:microcystin-dependent protein